MTYRLKPVGSCGGAEAWFGGVELEVFDDDLIRDVARGGREVASCPEALPPEAFADVLELLLDFARRASFDASDEVADGDVGRDFDEHVDMVAGEDAADDGDVELGADLLDDLSHAQPDFTVEDLEPVFGRPHDVVAMVKKRVTPAAVGHSLYPRKK